MTTTLPQITTPAITCLSHIHGCPKCNREPVRGGTEHVCDDLCVMQHQNRETTTGHARSHEPIRHDCGAILDDRQGNKYETMKFCAWATCVQYFCPGCGRFTSGWGPIGCQCEEQPCGHGTYDEYSRPGAGKFKKKSIFSRRRNR